MGALTITAIRFNSGTENLIYKVGEGAIAEINEHVAQGEGDKWFWDVVLDNGSVHRVFHPTDVYYKKTNP